ncbi:hypothetical protein BH23GEM11_BH23GEM11_04440 [soil metagenome]
MRAFWTAAQVVAVAFVIFLAAATGLGTIEMSLALLLAIPAVLVFRLTWKRT